MNAHLVALTGASASQRQNTYTLMAMASPAPFLVAPSKQVTTPSITTTTLAAGQVGVAYSQTLAASPSSSSLVWKLKSGSLPGGLTLNASSGVISGSPAAAGVTSFTVQVTNPNYPGVSSTATLSITVTKPSLSITTGSTLTQAQLGSSYSASLQATGGTPGYSWSIQSGSLPKGLSFSSTGVISGTPCSGWHLQFLGEGNR